MFNTGSISFSKGCFQHLSVNPHDTCVREGMSAAAAEVKLQTHNMPKKIKGEALCGNISSVFSPFSPHGAPAVDGYQCIRDQLELQRGLGPPSW